MRGGTSRPVRVAQVLPCDDVGGTEAMVSTLVRLMDRRSIAAHVITLAPPGPVARELRELGLPVRSLGGRGALVAFLRLASVLWRERFDVIVVYGFRPGAVVRLLRPVVARRSRLVRAVRGRHVSAQEHSDDVKARALLRLEVLASPLVHVYDANSEGALRLLADAGIRRGKLRYIPNGIDVSLWPRRDQAGLPPKVVCVARFVPVKRQADLVLAARDLHQTGLYFRLVLVGDGPTRPAVKRLAEEGIGELFEFPGVLTVAEIKQLLSRAYAFCLPSAGEGMPGSVLEAMACELPVVGTRVNGTADLVVDGETGLLVSPGRPTELAEALGALLADPALSRRMGEAGRERVASCFGIDRMVGAKQDLYRSLASL